MKSKMMGLIPVATCYLQGGMPLVSSVLYGATSVSIAFMNKLLMSTMQFNYPVFIMMCQMIFTIALLHVLHLFRLIELPPYTIARGWTFAFPALCYGINSVFALTALNHMNLALYGVLKRCVPVVTLCLSVLVLKKGHPSTVTIFSVGLLTLGCVVAGKLINYTGPSNHATVISGISPYQFQCVRDTNICFPVICA